MRVGQQTEPQKILETHRGGHEHWQKQFGGRQWKRAFPFAIPINRDRGLRRDAADDCRLDDLRVVKVFTPGFLSAAPHDATAGGFGLRDNLVGIARAMHEDRADDVWRVRVARIFHSPLGKFGVQHRLKFL